MFTGFIPRKAFQCNGQGISFTWAKLSHTKCAHVCLHDTSRAGDLGLEMYIICKGSVAVIGKHNHLIGLLSVGQHFGEIALFTEVRVCCALLEK